MEGQIFYFIILFASPYQIEKLPSHFFFLLNFVIEF